MGQKRVQILGRKLGEKMSTIRDIFLPIFGSKFGQNELLTHKMGDDFVPKSHPPFYILENLVSTSWKRGFGPKCGQKIASKFHLDVFWGQKMAPKLHLVAFFGSKKCQKCVQISFVHFLTVGMA